MDFLAVLMAGTASDTGYSYTPRGTSQEGSTSTLYEAPPSPGAGEDTALLLPRVLRRIEELTHVNKYLPALVRSQVG